MEEKEKIKQQRLHELVSILKQFIKNETEQQLAACIIQAQEMTNKVILESAIMKIEANKRNQFATAIFISEDGNQNANQLEFGQFFATFSEEGSEALRNLQNNNRRKHLQLYLSTMTLEKSFNRHLNQKKNGINQAREMEESSKIEKFKMFLSDSLGLLECYTPEFVEKILKEMDLYFFRFYKPFVNDTLLRAKVHKLLTFSTTFKKLKLYDSKDIDAENENLERLLIRELPFTEAINLEVFEVLMDNPTSNIVANHTNISEFQKNQYYSSEFYKSKALERFAQIKCYPESKTAKITDEIGTIFDFINISQYQLNETIFQHIKNFKLAELFDRNLFNSSFVEEIFTFIQEQCPNYYDGYKKIRYLKQKPEEFKFNKEIQKRFQIRDFFLSIKLPYTEWDQLEQSLFTESYENIDKISLSQEGKLRLWQFIAKNMYPYIDQKNNTLSYKDQISEELEIFFIKLRITQPYTYYKVFIQEFLEHFESSSCNELHGMEKTSIFKGILTCLKFQAYKKNQKINFPSLKKEMKRYLIEEILKINVNKQIYVKYPVISSSIDKFLEDPDFKTFSTLPEYVCNLTEFLDLYKNSVELSDYISQFKQVNPAFKQTEASYTDPSKVPTVVVPPVVVPPVVEKKSKEALEEEKKAIIANLINIYDTKLEGTQIQIKIADEKTLDKKIIFLEKILILNPYDNAGVKYDAYFDYNGIMAGKINRECALENVKKLVKESVDRFVLVYKELSAFGGSPMKPPAQNKPTKEELQAAKTNLIQKFYKTYQEKFEKSFVLESLNGRNEPDRTAFAELVLKANFYENEDTKVQFSNAIMKNKVKKDCANPEIKAEMAGIAKEFEAINQEMSKL